MDGRVGLRTQQTIYCNGLARAMQAGLLCASLNCIASHKQRPLLSLRNNTRAKLAKRPT